jgi:hypothetical protein
MRVENLKAELKTSFALLKLEVIQASLVSRIYTASSEDSEISGSEKETETYVA